MIHRRTRRRVRAMGLRCLRVVRRHHFSLLSAGVLGGALFLALTSTSFYAPKPPAAAVSQPAPIDQPPPPITLASPAAPSTAFSAQRTIVYYLIAKPQQRYELEAAAWSDTLAGSRAGVRSPLPAIRDFVLIRTPEEEWSVYQHLKNVIDMSQMEGYIVQVVDLR